MQAIRDSLVSICHGAIEGNLSKLDIYSYQTTLKSFLKRYNSKSRDTQVGMIGEFLTHVLIPRLYDEYLTASAFFNIEENSIKKGFDLVLFNTKENNIWITEVKSGEKHQNKSIDKTSKHFLGVAKNDLLKRLSAPEFMYWYNAIDHARKAVSNNNNYKDTIIELLGDDSSYSVQGTSSSKKHYAFLVSSLFEPSSNKISIQPAKDFHDKSHSYEFKGVTVLTIQKSTYTEIIEFIECESNQKVLS